MTHAIRKGSLNILLVDDREDFRQSFASWLTESLGHRVVEAKSTCEAIELFKASRYDLAIVDYSLDLGGEGNGLTLLGNMKAIDPDFPIIVITGYGNRALAQRALRAGALWYLDKPPDLVEIEVLLEQVSRSRDRSSQQIIAAISDAITSAPDTSGLISAIAQRSADVMHADACDILIIDSEVTAAQMLPSSWTFTTANQKVEYSEALGRTLSDGFPQIVQGADFPFESNNAIITIRSYVLCPCPPQPKPSAVIVAYFASDLEPNKVNQAAEELGKIVGATLPKLHALQLNEVKALGLALLRASTAEEVFKEIAKTLETSFSLASYALCLFENSAGRLSFPIAVAKGSRLIIEPMYLALRDEEEAEFLSEIAIKAGRVIELPDQSSLATSKSRPCPIGDKAIGSYLEVPIRVDLEQPAFGAISIRKESQGRFPDSTKRILEEIARLSAPTLARLRKTRLGEEVLKHILRSNPDDVFKEIALALKELLFADLVTIYLYDSSRDRFGGPVTEIGQRMHLTNQFSWQSEENSLRQLLGVGEHFATSIHGDEYFTGKWVEDLGVCSSCGVLLRTSPERVQGALLLHFKRPRAFSGEERSDIRRFAEWAALARYITEAIEERQSMDRRSKAEGDAIEAISTSDRGKLAIILKQIASRVWPQCRVTLELLLFHRPTNSYQYLSGTPALVSAAEDPFKATKTLGMAPHHEKGGPQVMERPLLNLRVAIRVGDSRLGILLCEAEEPILSTQDRLFLDRLSRRLAGTLISAAREQSVELIMEVATRAAADPSNALGTVTELTHRVATGAGGEPTETTIFLLTGSMLEPVSAFPVDRLAEVRERVGSLSIEGSIRGVVARAAVRGETQVILNVHADPDYIPLDPRTQAELAVPVFGFDGKIVGVLNLEFQNPGSLNQDDRALVEALAEQAAVVNVLQSQALILAKTERMTTLSAALAILGIKAAESGHRLKGLVGSWRREVELCEEYMEGVCGEGGGRGMLLLRCLLLPLKTTGYLVKLRSVLKRLREALAEDHLEGSTEPVMERSQLSVSQWVAKVARYWRQQEPEIEMGLDDQIKSNVTILVNEYWLTRCVNNLIKNSMRAIVSLPSPPREIILRVRCEDKALRVEVHDNGPGIPDEVAKLLFTAQIPENLVAQGGHGTGCLLSSFIVQLYGGRIFLLSDVAKGAHVAIEFPIAGQTSSLLF